MRSLRLARVHLRHARSRRSAWLANVDFHIVRADVFVPFEAHVPVVVITRVPFGNQVLEIVGENALHVTLVLHVGVVLLLGPRNGPAGFRRLEYARFFAPTRLWVRLRWWRRRPLNVNSSSTNKRRRLVQHCVGLPPVVIRPLGRIAVRIFRDITSNTAQAWPTGANGEAVEVRVAPFARFKPRHAHVRLFFRRQNDGRHDDAHGQFRIECVLESHNVGPVTHKSETNILRIVGVRSHRLSCKRRPRV